MTEFVSILSTTPVFFTLAGVVIFCFLLVGTIELINRINAKQPKERQKAIKTIYNILFIIIFIFLIISTFYIMMNAQIESANNFNSYCDNKYGKNNWTQVDITGTPEGYKAAGRFYIGQVWGCAGK